MQNMKITKEWKLTCLGEQLGASRKHPQNENFPHCRAFPHERLNTSKGVIRSRKLPLAIAEETTVVLGKQGVTNIRRISIRKGEKQIQTNSYILTFNQLHTPKKVKIDYCLERVEMYVPTLLGVLQMPKIWTPHEILQRTTDMC